MKGIRDGIVFCSQPIGIIVVSVVTAEALGFSGHPAAYLNKV
jgi:hypothetical protein